jgi:hypothetical protein
MINAKRLRRWLLLGVTGIGATGDAVGADFNCCKAPRCWQYHRNECFGHYPTRWRSWEESCGMQVQPLPAAATGKFSSVPGGVVQLQRIPAVGPTTPSPNGQNLTAASSKSPDSAARIGDVQSRPPAVVQFMSNVNMGSQENPLSPPLPSK